MNTGGLYFADELPDNRVMTYFSPYADQLRNSPPETVRREIAATNSRLSELREECIGGYEGEVIRRMWENRRAVAFAVLEEKTPSAHPRTIWQGMLDASGRIVTGECAGQTLAEVFSAQAARVFPGEFLSVVYGEAVRRWTWRGPKTQRRVTLTAQPEI